MRAHHTPALLAMLALACNPSQDSADKTPAPTDKPAPSKAAPALPEDARQTLAEYGLQVLDAKMAGEPDPKAPQVDAGGFEYDKVFVTLYTDGRIRGCQSGRAGALADDVVTAVHKAIADKRFGGAMIADEGPLTDINFAYLYDRQKVEPGKKLAYEPGVHAIEIRNGKDKAFFKAEVPITKNYTKAKTLKRLCKKAKLAPDCHESPDTQMYTYRTLTFHHRRKDAATTELYRGNVAKDPALTPKLVRERLTMALGWFQNNLHPDTGLLRYQYFPSPDKYDTDNNHVRQIASLWAVLELRAHLGLGADEALDRYATETVNFYLNNHLQQRPDHAFVSVDGKGKLAFNAFLILSLLHMPQYPQAQQTMESLAKGLMHQQRPDGSFATYFESDRTGGEEFYPGESMLAMMRLHQKTGQAELLDTVKKAFPHYRDYWRNKRNTPMLSWHSQTYRLLYKATKDKDVAEHAFELNDWLIKEHQVTQSPYPDLVGGFSRRGKPGISSATYLEGLADAYELAIAVGDKARQESYSQALRGGLAFVLRLQFTPDNTFYLKNAKPALGGFRQSLVKNNLRNDNTQHAAMALMKADRYGIFSQSGTPTSK